MFVWYLSVRWYVVPPPFFILRTKRRCKLFVDVYTIRMTKQWWDKSEQRVLNPTQCDSKLQITRRRVYILVLVSGTAVVSAGRDALIPYDSFFFFFFIHWFATHTCSRSASPVQSHSWLQRGASARCTQKMQRTAAAVDNFLLSAAARGVGWEPAIALNTLSAIKVVVQKSASKFGLTSYTVQGIQVLVEVQSCGPHVFVLQYLKGINSPQIVWECSPVVGCGVH